MKYFFSDLDRTINFSYKFITDDIKEDLINVEIYKGKELTFMSKKQKYLLNEIKNLAVFVPITARTFIEAMRLDFIRENPPKWMITGNGSAIHHYGKLDEDYHNYIENKISKMSISPLEMYTKTKEIFKMDKNKDKVSRIKLANGYFLMLRFKDLKKDYHVFSSYSYELQKAGYVEYISHDKLYLIPSFIKKELALEYLIENKIKNIDKSFGAGDTTMDLNMIKSCDMSLAPRNANFSNRFDEIDFVSKEKYFKGSEEMLSKILDEL